MRAGALPDATLVVLQKERKHRDWNSRNQCGPHTEAEVRPHDAGKPNGIQCRRIDHETPNACNA
jgi:hypothetical protein